MTTTPYAAPYPAAPAAPAAAPIGRPTFSTFALWVPVLTWCVTGAFLVIGNQAHGAGLESDSLGSSVNTFLSLVIAGGVACLAFVSVVIAAVFSASTPDTRSTGVWGNAIFTAATGALAVAVAAWLTGDEARILATNGDAVPWQVAAGVSLALPFVAIAVERLALAKR